MGSKVVQVTFGLQEKNHLCKDNDFDAGEPLFIGMALTSYKHNGLRITRAAHVEDSFAGTTL